jgi:hypothetical protein
MELGVAQTAVDGTVDDAPGLLAALAGATLLTGRASYLIRAWTPMAKVLQRMRGNRRIVPDMPPPPSAVEP